MSSVKVQGNASGTGIFTVAAPATNTDRTLTLPDQTGTVLTNAGPFTANASASNGAVTIDASNNVGVGTSSPSGKLTVVEGAAPAIRIQGDASTNVGRISFTDNAVTRTNALLTADNSGNLAFATNGTTERARIDSSGNLLVNTTGTTPVQSNTAGAFAYRPTFQLEINGNNTQAAFFGRTSDGMIIGFYESGTREGSIDVSGTTVSYNGGHLSRWAQTEGPKDTTLIKGTVLSNLDAMNVYTDAEGNPVPNEQLNKVKVSDVEGDLNVAGVFVNWAHDEQHNVDEINMAMTGDMIIRIAQGVTVQRGDLLMSAGDGTAKPQGDDIVRSKTVAKVTSTHITCTYADGSYCVPCVLMAC